MPENSGPIPTNESGDAARQALRNNTSIASAELKKLADVLRQLHVQGKTTNEDVRLLARHLGTAGDGAAHLRKAAQEMAQILVQNAGSLTKSGRDAHRATAEGLRDLAKSADPETGAHIRKDLAAHNRARFDALLKASPADHAANIRSGFFKGSVEALQSGLLGGKNAALADKLASLTGAIFPTIEAVVGLVSAFVVLGEIISITSQNALDASKSGFELGNSLTEAAGAGAAYGLAVDRATNFGTSMSQDQLTQYLQTARGLGVFGGAGTGKAYTASLDMGEGDRNDLRLKAVAFTAALVQAGSALGVSGQESVKFGTQIMALSHSSFASGERNFYRMASSAEKLGITMDPLMGMFGALAEKADFAGESGDRLVSQVLSVTSALQYMGSKGFEGFKNLDPEKMQAVGQSIIQMMMGMSDSRVAALTMKPGQTWEETLHAAASGNQFKLRRDAILNAMQMSGANIKKPGSITDTQAQMLASLSGVQGDLGMQTKMGHYLASLAATGRGNLDISSQMAKMYDSKFSESKSIGELTIAGADPMQALGAIMKDVLKVLVELTEVVIGHLPGAARSFAKDTESIYRQIRQGEASRHAGVYANSQGGYKPPSAALHLEP